MLSNELVKKCFVEGKNNEPHEKGSITLYLCWDEGFFWGKNQCHYRYVSFKNQSRRSKM